MEAGTLRRLALQNPCGESKGKSLTKKAEAGVVLEVESWGLPTEKLSGFSSHMKREQDGSPDTGDQRAALWEKDLV